MALFYGDLFTFFSRFVFNCFSVIGYGSNTMKICQNEGTNEWAEFIDIKNVFQALVENCKRQLNKKNEAERLKALNKRKIYGLKKMKNFEF